MVPHERVDSGARGELSEGSWLPPEDAERLGHRRGITTPRLAAACLALAVSALVVSLFLVSRGPGPDASNYVLSVALHLSICVFCLVAFAISVDGRNWRGRRGMRVLTGLTAATLPFGTFALFRHALGLLY